VRLIERHLGIARGYRENEFEIQPSVGQISS
jgi:hypothetical protein